MDCFGRNVFVYFWQDSESQMSQFWMVIHELVLRQENGSEIKYDLRYQPPISIISKILYILKALIFTTTNNYKDDNI